MILFISCQQVLEVLRSAERPPTAVLRCAQWAVTVITNKGLQSLWQEAGAIVMIYQEVGLRIHLYLSGDSAPSTKSDNHTFTTPILYHLLIFLVYFHTEQNHRHHYFKSITSATDWTCKRFSSLIQVWTRTFDGEHQGPGLDFFWNHWISLKLCFFFFRIWCKTWKVVEQIKILVCLLSCSYDVFTKLWMQVSGTHHVTFPTPVEARSCLCSRVALAISAPIWGGSWLGCLCGRAPQGWCQSGRRILETGPMMAYGLDMSRLYIQLFWLYESIWPYSRWRIHDDPVEESPNSWGDRGIQWWTFGSSRRFGGSWSLSFKAFSNSRVILFQGKRLSECAVQDGAMSWAPHLHPTCRMKPGSPPRFSSLQ